MRILEDLWYGTITSANMITIGSEILLMKVPIPAKEGIKYLCCVLSMIL